MKVRRDSWHHRFLDGNGDVPSNLCKYVQKLVLLISAYASGAILVPTGTVFIAGLMYHRIVYDMGLGTFTDTVVVPIAWLPDSVFFWLVVFFAGVIVWAFVVLAIIASLIFAFWFVVENTQKTFRQRRGANPDAEPGLISSWWAAKKDKVCPLIEVVDE